MLEPQKSPFHEDFSFESWGVQRHLNVQQYLLFKAVKNISFQLNYKSLQKAHCWHLNWVHGLFVKLLFCKKQIPRSPGLRNILVCLRFKMMVTGVYAQMPGFLLYLEKHCSTISSTAEATVKTMTSSSMGGLQGLPAFEEMDVSLYL